MECKELTLEELTRGYVWSEEEQLYQCIFCGDKMEEGLIYFFQREICECTSCNAGAYF